MQTGASPANAIRASRTNTLHRQAECKTANPSDLHAAESCSSGDVHVRTSLGRRRLGRLDLQLRITPNARRNPPAGQGCQCAQRPRLLGVLTAVQSVVTRDIAAHAAAHGLVGPQVGQLIHQARIEAVAQWLYSGASPSPEPHGA